MKPQNKKLIAVCICLCAGLVGMNFKDKPLIHIVGWILWGAGMSACLYDLFQSYRQAKLINKAFEKDLEQIRKMYDGR